MPNYYQVLGLPASATAEQVKQAYRHYVKHLHPDRHQNATFFNERFQEVQEAYEVLTDPVRRFSHDRALRAASMPVPVSDWRTEQLLRARAATLEKELRQAVAAIQRFQIRLSHTRSWLRLATIGLGLAVLGIVFLLLRTSPTEKILREPYQTLTTQVDPPFPADTTLPQNTYTAAERMPQFPGGTAGLLRYVSAQVQYPPLALSQGIKGQVFASFVVDSRGWVRDIRIVKPLGGGTDEETERVLHTLPRFVPGYQNGRPVNVAFTIPITFTIAE